MDYGLPGLARPNPRLWGWWVALGEGWGGKEGQLSKLWVAAGWFGQKLEVGSGREGGESGRSGGLGLGPHHRKGSMGTPPQG